MPGNIAQYTSPVDKLQPSEIGAEALARAGRTEAGLYHQAGEDYQRTIDQVGGQAAKIIDDHETMSEISQGAATLATMHANFTDQWNKMASQPGAASDKSIQGTFLNSTVEPGLQDFQDGFQTEKGQQWALTQADQMRMHYTEKTSADMSVLAGEAIKKDIVTQTNQLAATTYKDPSSIESALTQIDGFYDAAKLHNTGTLTPEQIAQLDSARVDAKNEVVKNLVKGVADNLNDPQGPQKAAAILDGGHFDQYIPAKEQDEMHRYIQEQIRERQNLQTVNAAQQERAQKQQEQAIATDLFNKSYDKDTGTFTFSKENMQAIMSNPNLPAMTKMNIEGAVKKIATDTSFDDPATMQSFASRLSSASTQPLTHDDLLTAMAQGKLAPSGYNFFSERLKQTPDAVAEKTAFANAMGQAQKTILTTPGAGIPVTPEQRQRETDFTNWFVNAYQTGLNDPSFKGMSQSQKAQILLSSTDPKGLLTPEHMQRFMTTPQQMLQDGMKSVGPLPSGLSTPSAGINITAPAASDIAFLKANPDKKAQFDRTFGAGQADKILGSK